MCFMCTCVSMKGTEEIALFIINSILQGRGSRDSVDGGGAQLWSNIFNN